LEELMQVRPLSPSDVEMATELLGQLGYQMSPNEAATRIARVLSDKEHFAAVADDDGKVLGLIHAFERPALEKPCEAVVQSLAVDSRARKTGVGRALMAAAQAWAQERGLEHVVLHTRIDRDDARAFYEQLGYERAATAHLMKKSLKAR
jgi:ribosomal protein S18 acetylase RimI-like enzyme